jgi:hypothetical protein
LDPELLGQFSLFGRSVVSRRCRSVVAGTLVELEIAVVKLLETRAALAIRNRVTHSAGIGSANRSALELGVPMYMDSLVLDARMA